MRRTVPDRCRPRIVTAEGSRRRACTLLLLVAGLAIPRPAAPQGHGDAAFLFGYRAKPGMEADFAEGYRRHLAWHAERQDSLAWLGWSVISGAGLGMFVDGVFGARFQAIDDRVDPQGDARDAALNVTAYADAVYRYVFRLRRDLSSAARLEAARPAAMQKVVHVRLPPEGVHAFERGLERLGDDAQFLDYAVYELVAGGAQPAFLLVIQLDAFAQLEDATRDPSRAALRLPGVAVVHAESEIWLYRPDLTYVPQ